MNVTDRRGLDQNEAAWVTRSGLDETFLRAARLNFSKFQPSHVLLFLYENGFKNDCG